MPVQAVGGQNAGRVSAPVTLESPDGEPAGLVAGARPRAAPARPGEGSRLLPQQEVVKDEVALPAHHVAEQREQEAEGLKPALRRTDLTLDLQPARTLALPHQEQCRPAKM